MKHLLFCCCISILAIFLSYSNFNEKTLDKTNFTLIGTDFNEILPLKYSCDGAGIAPSLFWAGAPKETTSYAITMHRELGNGYEEVCMVQYHIDGKVSSLGEGDTISGVWGVNTLNDKRSYAAPCSSKEGSQTYVFTIYALSKSPSIRPANNTVTKAELELEMAFITLATATKTVVLEQQEEKDGLILSMNF